METRHGFDLGAGLVIGQRPGCVHSGMLRAKPAVAAIMITTHALVELSPRPDAREQVSLVHLVSGTSVASA